jgi:hypothetical protein
VLEKECFVGLREQELSKVGQVEIKNLFQPAYGRSDWQTARMRAFGEWEGK